MTRFIGGSIFQNDLLDGEEILWLGQPDVKKVFSKADIFLIPFSLLLVGFVWVAIRLSHDINPGDDRLYKFVSLLCAPAGLYMILGRFLFKAWLKRKSYYAVTNKRIFILTTIFRRNLQTLQFNALPAISESVNAAGFGTVRFDSAAGFNVLFLNTGMEFLGGYNYLAVPPAFYDIPDAHHVFQLVSNLQNKAEAIKDEREERW